ncbi:dihydroorotate oxidase [Latilactobacillus graminis]|uniref:Dihydroorotate dehydrogenase n=1 Tax=Latilactobacillus graminis DSM 20719 TaxID=1423752 RepID=A0AA89I076_9LACO|nr:dihydroorotate oxidase [Latilactobacillus graminis]KRM21386.1 dihydroorotate dehydrogenase 1 [Latilactobacillus graminis DSM 20719]
MISTKTTLAGIHFDNCLMNAAGVYCYDASELNQIQNSMAGTFVTKTATVTPRTGNQVPRYRATHLGSINSMGLPNKGLQYYMDYISQQQKAVPHKTYFQSIAGFNLAEDEYLLAQIQASDFTGVVELNLSCPNVPGKPQIGYDFETVEKILTRVFEVYRGPLGIKLPPYFDIVHFDQMATILNQFPLAFVNSVNSIGNGLIIDSLSERVTIKPKHGFGGIGGDYLKPTALANVHAFYQRLKPSIQIIGTGGIKSGQDAFEHILCGASMVQVGTALHAEGPQIFARLTAELKTIMYQKGYTTLTDFRGKLNYLD